MENLQVGITVLTETKKKLIDPESGEEIASKKLEIL